MHHKSHASRCSFVINRFRYIKEHIPKCFHSITMRFMFDYYYPVVSTFSREYIYKNNDLIENQTGGSNLMYEYRDYKFKVHIKFEDDELLVIFENHKDPQIDCCVLVVNNKTGIAIIQTMSNYSDCAIPSLPISKGGTTVLKAILSFVRKYKDDLHIKRIILKDNSIKHCDHCRESISLSNMYFLLYADTWYGKYGFRPYDSGRNKPDLDGIKRYQNNQKIIKNTKTKDVKLYEYVKQCVKEYKLHDIDLESIERKIIRANDLPLSLFFIKLMTEYKKYCCLFKYVSDKIFDALALSSFYSLSFYLDI